MQLFFISKLLLILLIRNSLSFLCSPTVLLWVCLCHAVLHLLTHLSVHLPAQMADSVWAELGLYPPQHPREHPLSTPGGRLGELQKGLSEHLLICPLNCNHLAEPL